MVNTRYNDISDNDIGLYLSILKKFVHFWAILGNIGQCLWISQCPEENQNSFSCSNPEQYTLHNIKQYSVEYYSILVNTRLYCMILASNFFGLTFTLTITSDGHRGALASKKKLKM